MPQNKWMNFTSVFNKVSVKKKKERNEKSSFSCRSIYVWYNVHNYMENKDMIYVSLQIIDNFTG